MRSFYVLGRTVTPFLRDDACKAERCSHRCNHADGQVFIDNDRMPPEELAAKITERLDHRGERKVYIRADARVLYG
jgi:hypothetical protein